VITTRRGIFAALGLASLALPAVAMAATSAPGTAPGTATTTKPHTKSKSHQTASAHKHTKHPTSTSTAPKTDQNA
jgi:hypothetical protein